MQIVGTMIRRKGLQETGIRRIRRAKGFRYVTADGRPIRGQKQLTRIAQLAIPPAWENVTIAAGPGEPLQAIGQDSMGKWQYRYHEQFMQDSSQRKYKKIVAFGQALKRARSRWSRDLERRGLSRRKVCAAMIRLMDAAAFRIGSENSARKRKTYGLTTLRRSHVEVHGNTIQFRYKGKSGIKHQRTVTDPALACVIRKLCQLTKGRLFQYQDRDGELHAVTAEQLNRYIKNTIGPEFTAKDFRTWTASVAAAYHLAVAGCVDNERLQKKQIITAIDAVATRLGNTRAVARKSYIAPRIVAHYLDGRTIAIGRSCGLDALASRKRGLTCEEKATLKLLRRRPKSDCASFLAR